MILSSEKNICEEIEIALFSDTELTEEQKKHAETCENCRALLSQMTNLKKDLSSLPLTGIEEGKISDSVMASITKHTSVPFPKFRFTHHLGTAAAVVIILVAALIIRNPSEPVNAPQNDSDVVKEAVFDAPVNNHVLNGISEDTAEENQNINDTARLAEYSDETPESAETEEPKLKFMARPMKNDTTEAITEPEAESIIFDVEEAIDNKAYFTDGADTFNCAANTEFAKNSPAEQENVQEAAVEEAAPEENTQEELSFLLSDSDIDESAPEEDAVSQEKVSSAGGAGAAMMPAGPESGLIFEGLDLADGEENFDYNISLANARLYELYGDGYVLSRQKLSELGVDNAKLLELAPTVTEEMFDFYKVILDIFE